ncbi:hypothetical protein ACFSE0_13860 [Ochrobactrum teleogrylli]|uniref:Uncharacterized protein n=1 Tax=Ochrobactrum teleogrylli TaxID=2479765 RepID=A0ABY2Y446_9HYPH|nr:hypothetical protein [[Ochrobactrum] teleogrylli]TNV16143.1 hypothetical protein FIC94_09935 [[Ochrobactrum] teleogrylli]
MPRPANPINRCKAERQARYRARLKAAGEPEADRVDTALAAVVAVLADVVERGTAQTSERAVLRALLLGTMRILQQEGFVEEKTLPVLRRRVSRLIRPDLERFVEISGIEKHLTERA